MSSFTDPTTLSHHDLEEGTALAPRFDAQGLVTAITVDATSKDVLMLAHMNAEALALTLSTGVAHYWSRSRGKIWKKGESSGELQKLVELRVDCDQDAVLAHRSSRPAAARPATTGRPSCFYRRVEDGALVDTGAPRLFDPAEVYKSE